MRAEIRGRLHVVIGFVADKDLDHILGLFGNLPADTIFYITQASVPRAMERHELLERFRNANPAFTTGLCDTPAAAYTLAREQAASDDIIFIGGSTFVVADFLASGPITRNKNPKTDRERARRGNSAPVRIKPPTS